MELQHTQNRRHLRGFTIIELVVVLGIIVVISTVTLASYGKFGGEVLLHNLAYDIALTVRQAQVQGLSGRTLSGTGSAQGHGIYMDLGSKNNQFMLYKNNTPIKKYPTAGELVDTYDFGRGYIASRICFFKGSVKTCTTNGKVDIFFKRPEPDAAIQGDIGTGAWTSYKYDSVHIILHAPQGYELDVLIGAAGQISVQKVSI